MLKDSIPKGYLPVLQSPIRIDFTGCTPPYRLALRSKSNPQSYSILGTPY